MSDVNPVLLNKLLSIYAKSELNMVENIEKVVDEAFQCSDDLYEVYSCISERLNIKFKLTKADVVNILSLFFINIREREMRLRLFETKPYWWLIAPDEERIKKYLITKLVTMLDKTSALGYSSVGSPTVDGVAKSVKEGSIPPVSELSNEELLSVLKRLAMNKKGKMVPSLLKKNLSNTNVTGLIEVLNELAHRELSESERRLLTEFVKVLIEYLKSINVFSKSEMSEIVEKMKQAIMENYHNMEVDDELIGEISELDNLMGYGLFYSMIDRIIEEDADKLVRLLPEFVDGKFMDLFEAIKQKLMDLTLTKTSWISTNHKKYIDYRRTVYKTIRNGDIPVVAYAEKQDTIGDIVLLVDASGSMRAVTSYGFRVDRHLDALQVGLITAWLFVKAVKEFGNGVYKLLIFADKIVDVTDYELEKIVSLVKNPDVLGKIIGGGTNLYPSLKYIEERYASNNVNLIIITDTGDLAVGKNVSVLKRLRERVKSFVVACPAEFFDETALAFKDSGVPLVQYKTFEDLIDMLKEIVS